MQRVLIDDSSPKGVLAVTESQRSFWGSKGSETSITDKLRAAGCPEFANRVEMHLLTCAGIPMYSPERTIHEKQVKQKNNSATAE